MGNRAIIKGVGTNIGVYVHWNGGYDSVLAFTQYCKLKGYRSLESAPAYGTARLAQTFGAGIPYEENRVFAQFAKSRTDNRQLFRRRLVGRY